VWLSLKLKLSLLIIGLLIPTVTLVSSLLLRQTEQSVTREMTKRGLTTARDLANGARSSILASDELALTLLVTDTLKNPDVAYVIVADHEGKVLAHRDLSQIGKPLQRVPGLTAVGGDPVVQGYVHPSHGRVIDFGVPLSFSQIRLGTLYLGLTQRTLDLALAAGRSQTIVITAGLVVVGIGAALGLATVLARPIRRLVDGTRTIEHGNLQVTLPVPSRDEIGFLTESFNQMTRSLREKQMITRAFGRYVAKQVVNEILKDPERLVLREERRDVTVLFCGIQGFAPLAETLPPEEIVALLNDFYGLMIDATFKHDGTLNEFFGDGIMAFFGAPIRDEAHTLHAVRTALAMRVGVAELSERRVRQGQVPITVGIGVNAGEVVAGTVGTEDRMKYAVVGDAVNLAARLETRAAAGQILVTRGTWERVRAAVEARALGPLRVKGKQQEVEVLEVLGLRTT
jgi:adenylate cyclase